MQTTSLKPLTGLRVLVTRPVDAADKLSERLSALGAHTIQVPMIAIVPPVNTMPLDTAVVHLSQYDWVIFTSAYGVKFMTKRMAELKVAPERLNKVKVAAIGPATAAAVERVAKKPEYVPKEFLSERIVEGLGDLERKRVLLPRADIASKQLPSLLRERGAFVDEVVSYQTTIPEDLTAERMNAIFAQGVNMVTFTSPSTVRNFAKVLSRDRLGSFMGNIRVACIGPVTADAANELGMHVDIVANIHTVDALVEAIVDEIGTV